MASASDESLLGFLEEVSGEVHLRVEESLGDGFVRLRSAEAERRQAKHDIRSVEDIVIELLRNARDAAAGNIYVATTRDGSKRLLTVIDDGNGIPMHLQERVFEPRVTSKLDTMIMDDWGVHGRGMALYSIRSNSSLARVALSAPEQGTALEVQVDTEQLPEKADQSTLPVLEKGDDGQLRLVRGPHNIARTAIAFSLVNRHAVNVYLGSPSEVAATLVDAGTRSLGSADLLRSQGGATLPLEQRLAACTDAAALERLGQSMGLHMSERTAHRILAGQIKPLAPILDSVLPRRSPGRSSPDILRDNRGLRIAEEDSEAFARALEKAFEPLAERYYLTLRDLPRVRVKGDSITVRFDIEKDL